MLQCLSAAVLAQFVVHDKQDRKDLLLPVLLFLSGHTIRNYGFLKLEKQPSNQAYAAGFSGDRFDHRSGALNLNKRYLRGLYFNYRFT